MSQPPVTPEARYAALVETLRAEPGVAQEEGKGFGSAALKVRNRIFAMLVRGRLVVKLPRQRVEALVACGEGERYDPRRDGRLMKEWLVVASSREEQWPALAREALAFVAGQG